MLILVVHLPAVNEVNLSRKWKIPTAGLKKDADDAAGRT